MPERIHFAPLGSADARKIGRLQKKLFAAELTESEDEIREILRSTEEHLVCNLSYGLFDNTRMVGYVFAYVETRSIFHGRDEEVVYIKEIALTAGYENYLRPLFQKLFAQWSAYTPHLPIEAHAQADAVANWRRLKRLFRFFGLTLTTIDEEGKEGRPPYQLLRLDVAHTTASIAEQAIPLPAVRWQFRDNLAVSVVQDPRQWLSLKERWNELLRDTHDSNAFQSFDYLWEWWKHFGTWNELHVLVVHRGDSVIGVVPFMIEYFPIFGRVVRKLMFISAPMEMSRPKFVFGADADTCLPAVLGYFESNAHDWDVIDIDEQLQDRHADLIGSHFKNTGHLVAQSQTVCPYLDLEGTWERFLLTLSRKMRSNVNRMRRHIAAFGATHVRTINSWPALETALNLHCEIEERSWKAQEGLGIANDKSHYFFYQGLARAFGRHQNFEVRILECDGKPLASTFGIRRDNVFQSLKIAHDKEYDKLSPGTALESYELEDLFRQKVSRYEFMGSFLANKLRWTATVHETVNLHIYQRQPRLVLFYFIFFVFKRRLKRVLEASGQLDRVDRILRKFKNNPFPRY